MRAAFGSRRSSDALIHTFRFSQTRGEKRFQRRGLRDEPFFAAEDFLAFAPAGLDAAFDGGEAVFRAPLGEVFS